MLTDTRLTPGRLLLILFAIAIAVYLGRESYVQVNLAYDQIRAEYEYEGFPALPNSDFPMFYGGARLSRTSDRGELYDLPRQVREILLVRGANPGDVPAEPDPTEGVNQWLRYYNPPFFIIALSPLTYLSVQDAYLVATAVNVALLVVLAVVLGFVLRWRQPESALLALSLAALSPVTFALHHGQPTILLAILFATGYLALRNRRFWLAGILLSLTSIKPHWVLPDLALLKSNPRLFLPLLTGGVVFALIPLLLLGPNTVVDYFHLVTDRGNGDLTDEIYAGALLSWAGFFRALLGETRPDLWFVASVVTLGVFGLLCWRAGT